MATNNDKIKPFITPDWTQADGRSKPFYQVASGSLVDRYSVTVLSEYTNTGGHKQDRMDACIEPGLNRILRYYSKTPDSSISVAAITEDYYVSPRPAAKMKVLISLPCSVIDSLPDKELAKPRSQRPEHEIKLNTIDLETKLDIAANFIIKYGQEIEKFHGKVYDYNYNKESSKFLGFMPALSRLLQDNDITFSGADSFLITLLCSDDYEVLYSSINRGSGAIALSKGFDNFIDNPSIKYKRVIKMVSKLDKIQETSITNNNLSWSKFFEDFVYNPPKIDFSMPRPSSPDVSEKVKEKEAWDNSNPIKTKEQLTLFRGFMNLPENSQALVDFSREASIFVGDSVIGNLEQLGDTIGDITAVFEDVLDATGLDGILKAALDCLDINTEFGLGMPSDDLLNSINQLFSQFEKGLPHNIPTLPYFEDFPIVNLLEDIGKAIMKAVVGALIGALIAMVKELIKLLFQFCSECSIRTEDGFVKKYNKLNYGSGGGLSTGISWSSFAGSQMMAKATTGVNAFSAGVLGGFGTSKWTGDMEAFAQDTLKNSINNIERLYSHEATRIFNILKTSAGSNEEETWHGLDDQKRAERSAINRTDMSIFGDTPEELIKSGFTGDMTRQQILNAVKKKSPWKAKIFSEASQELSGYLDACMAAWTPGELGNALLGCGISPEAREVSRNALPPFPNLDITFGGGDDDNIDDNLADIWSTMGKMIGQDPILEAIANLANNIPEEYKCLNELDDTALRERLLAKKDPHLDADEIADQVAKAKQRNKEKIQEISDLMGREDIFKGKMPPLFCSASADGTIIPGILPVSHPTTQYAMKKALDLTYDSLKMSFNSDVRTWVPALSVRTTTNNEISRVSRVYGPAFGPLGELVFNPAFTKQVREGIISYGSLPYGAKVPGSAKPPEEWADPNEPEKECSGWDECGQPIRFNTYLGGWMDITSWNNPQGVGMWDEGQTEPTPIQEYHWERANVKFDPIREEVDGVMQTVAFKKYGGREFNDENSYETPGANPQYPLGYSIHGSSRTPATISDYTRVFGYSPIPVYEVKEGPPKFLPGLKNSFRSMCWDPQIFNMDFSSGPPRENRYSFSVPNNVLTETGINLAKIQENIDTYSGDLLDPIKASGFADDIKKSFELIQTAKFNISYVVPLDNGTTRIPMDSYSLQFSVEVPDAPPEIEIALAKLNLPGASDAIPINEKAKKVIQDKSLRITRDPATDEPVQPQRGYFHNFSMKSWETGGSIWRNGVKVRGDEASSDFHLFHDDSVINTKIPQSLYEDNAYKNIYKDLMCSFTNQLAVSPYMDLEPSEDGDGLLSVNFAPAKILGYDPDCQKTLLDVNIIKEQIMREYELLQCINRNWRSEDNMSSNKDAPRQIASRAGCILLTVRTYVIEYLLRFAFAFHYFTPAKPEDVDETSVYYVYNKMNQELEARGIGTPYYLEFAKQTIELYNRNKPTSQHLSFTTRPTSQHGTAYVHFKKAIDSIIRYQIFSVSKRLGRDFIELKGDTDAGDPHSILLQQWIPTVEPPAYDKENRFWDEDEQTNKKLGGYNETTNVLSITGEEIAALKPGGMLSEETIDFLPDPYINSPHSKPIGKYFLDFFAPDREYEQFEDYSRAQARLAREMIWPVHGHGTQTRQTRQTEASPPPVQDEQGNIVPQVNVGAGNLVWPQIPVMGSMSRENAILNVPSRMGFNWGEPWRAYKRADNGYINFYRLGISDAEQSAMETITQMMYAAQFWTLPSPGPSWDGLGIKVRVHSQGNALSREKVPGARQSAYDFFDTANDYKIDASDWAHVNGTTWNGKPFWSFHLFYQPINDEWPSHHQGAAAMNWLTTQNFLDNVKFSTRTHGPGSLLRWATQKKRIIPAHPKSERRHTTRLRWVVNTFHSHADPWRGEGRPNHFHTEIKDSEGKVRPTVAHGHRPGPIQPHDHREGDFTTGNYQPYEFQYTYTFYPAFEASGFNFPVGSGVNVVGNTLGGEPNRSTMPVEGASELNIKIGPKQISINNTIRIGHKQLWWDIFSNSTQGWNPTTTSKEHIGCPDLPESARMQLGNIPAQMNTTIAGTNLSTQRSRPNNLQFFLLPQDHWIGWYETEKRSKWYRIVETAINQNQNGTTNYISLLDLHPDAVRRALIWEQGMYRNFITLLKGEESLAVNATASEVRPTSQSSASQAEEIAFYEELVEHYTDWIFQWEEVMRNLERAKSQRECAANLVTEVVNAGRVDRNKMETPLMYDLDEGNLILEPYIRVEDYSDEEAQEKHIAQNVGWINGVINDVNWKQITKSAGSRDAFTRGVVAIDKWDEFMMDSFGENFPRGKLQLPDRIIEAIPDPDEDCGDDLPSRNDRIIPTPPPDDQEPRLEDYFKGIYYGLRIMYLPKPTHITSEELGSAVQAADLTDAGRAIAANEKAFFVEETATYFRPLAPLSRPRQMTRVLHPYPLVSVEIPVPMSTSITEAITAREDGILTTGGVALRCGGHTPIREEPNIIGYFRWRFKTGVNSERFSSPRDVLERQMRETDDYAFLFKYCFPLNRMLSLLNIYSSTYVASLPNAQRVFEPTKEDLMGIFLRSLRSGNWKDACNAGNGDILDALANGINLPLAGLLMMSIKWPMLIFKGFMEQADINIAISKNIQNAMKLMNATIAAIQTQANAVQQAAAAGLDVANQLANLDYTKEDCGIGIHAPGPGKPPDALFDPIESNLLYIPETWMLGLALLPASIFAPFLLGPSINIPWGLAYWVLDDSRIDWLNAFPEFPHNLWKKKDKLGKEPLELPDCPPDFILDNIFKNGGNDE